MTRMSINAETRFKGLHSRDLPLRLQLLGQQCILSANTPRLRLVKKTVNFDGPDVTTSTYGDETRPRGYVMTYIPFLRASRAARASGREVVRPSSPWPKDVFLPWRTWRGLGRGVEESVRIRGEV